MLRIHFWLCFLFLGMASYSQVPIDASVLEKLDVRGLHVSILDDSTRKMKVAEVIQKQARFVLNQQEIPTFFMSGSRYWVRFVLQLDPRQSYVLELENTVIKDFAIHLQYPDGRITTLPRIYWGIEPEKRALHTWRNAVELPSEKTLTVYAEVYKSYGTLRIPFVIWTKKAFERSEKSRYSTTLYFFGIASILCLICLMVYFNTRQRKFLYYFMYVLSILLWRAFIEGFFVPFLSTNLLFLANPFYGNFFIVFSLLFFLLFLKTFLMNKDITPKYQFTILKILLFTVALSLVILLITGINALTFRWMGWLYVTTVVCTNVFTMLVIASGLIRKQGSALVYLISGTPLFIVSLLTVLCNAGIVATQWQPAYGFFEALIFEIVVLSIGLAFDFKKFILDQKMREIEAVRQSQKEKERISRDLHDTVGGQLSYVLYSLEGVKETGAQKRNEIVEDINHTLRHAIGNLRETIWAIHEENISIQDLSDRLKVYVRNLFRHREIDIDFRENISEDRHLQSAQALQMFRICQEILHNTFKHAHATNLVVNITSHQHINIQINDNGIGFFEDLVTEGMGLTNIKTRAQENGIRLTIQTAPSQGTKYSLLV